jgi:autotransporter-associated beta strand protein
MRNSSSPDPTPASQGTAIVNAGTLTLAGGNALADTVAVSGAAEGTLKLTASEVIGTLSGSLAVSIQGNTLNVSGSGTSNYSGFLSGSGAFLKTGSLGTLTLSGSSALSGSMSVSGGTLALANWGTLTSGTVTVSGAATTLELGTTAQRVGSFNQSGGTVQNGSLIATSFNMEAGTVSALLGGSGAFVKNTSGSVLLTGSNNLSAPWISMQVHCSWAAPADSPRGASPSLIQAPSSISVPRLRMRADSGSQVEHSKTEPSTQAPTRSRPALSMPL